MKREKCAGCCALAMLVLGAAGIIVSMIFLFVIFPALINNGVKDQKLLGLNKDGTYNKFTATWAHPQYISTMQYWIYDYKNPIGILNRAIYPDVEEKGPYAYDETIVNENINFSSNGETMKFSQRIIYTFNPDKSCKGCDPKKDHVYIPDVSFMIGMDALDETIEKLFSNPIAEEICEAFITDPNKNKTEECRKLRNLIEGELGTLIDVFEVGPFIDVTIDQLIFSGYQAPMIDKVVNKLIWLINNFIGREVVQPQPPQTVALNTENATTDQLYTVLTGKSDSEKTGFILRWDNMTNASLSSEGNLLPKEWWPNADRSYCRQESYARLLDGTNGDYFQNFLKKTDLLPVFIYDLCRTTHLKYDRDTTVEGIPAYRFVLPADEFNTTIPKNCGFCNPLKYGAYENPANSRCLPPGLLDISGCQNNAPIMLSKPHFYQADTIVSRFVPRFNATYEEDETMLDIEPYTGTVMTAQKRSQINVLVNQLTHINAYSVLRPGAYPLLWSNESFYMDKGTKDQLNQIYVPMKIVTIVCWCVFGLGVLLFLIGAIVMIGTAVQIQRKRK